MSCSGLHCAGCSAGVAVPVVPLLAAFGAAWIAEHIIEVAVVCGASGVLAVAAVVALMKWADRRDARQAATWQLLSARREALSAPSKPQVAQGTAPAAIEYHVHHHYYADSREPARVIPGKVVP